MNPTSNSHLNAIDSQVARQSLLLHPFYELCLQKRLITQLKAGARCDPHVIKEVRNLERPEIDSQPRINAGFHQNHAAESRCQAARRS